MSSPRTVNVGLATGWMVVGYADSNGYTEKDTPRAWAWKYRDYCIRAFNDSLPGTVLSQNNWPAMS